MATDPKDKELLSQLEKSQQGKAQTSSTKPAWQEKLERHQTVPASKSIEAAEVISGFAGSWAGLFSQGEGIRDGGRALDAPPLQTKASKLGQPGLPEINFVPYSHNTNRFANKGPSLLGHPASFSVIGPTLKSPNVDWQWKVTDNSGVPGTGDVLTIDTDGILSTVGNSIAPSYATISDCYGFTNFSDVENGIYLVVTQTGAKGDLDAGGGTVGGVGDGFFGDSVGNRQALKIKDKTSKFEIFRVTAVGGNTLTLDHNKRLATYFTIGGAQPVLRAVMLITPEVARLTAIPGSGGGVGKERVFALMPPRKALNSDLMPPHDLWTASGFDPFRSNAQTGNTADYKQDVKLPVPIPRRAGQANLDTNSVDVGVGRMFLGTTAKPTADIGKIIHIHDVVVRGQARLFDVDASSITKDAGLDRLLGWFEVVDDEAGGQNGYLVKRVVEVDPKTGTPFYGVSEVLRRDALQQDGSTAAGVNDQIEVHFTVHDPVDTIYSSAHFDWDKVSSTRLTNIINPHWVERSGKRTGLEGVSPAHADKAIFDTSTSNAGAAGSNANPGSLLDLGFRMVLFPAKEGAGPIDLVPDFDKPITSREVVLDASVNEAQWIDIDYASGLVTLSHTPDPAGARCDVAPTGLVTSATLNARDEIVLFAACVPYSMEKGQLGAGVRVTGGDLYSGDGCTTPQDQADLYGHRYAVALANQTFTVGTTTQLDLTALDSDNKFPPTGFVEVVTGKHSAGSPGMSDADNNRVSTFGYTGKTDVGGVFTRLTGVYGGGVNAGSFTVDAANPHTLVLRRDVVTPNDGVGKAGTDYQYDTTYGHANRTTALRFLYADLQKNPDGTTTVIPTGVQGPALSLRAYHPLGGSADLGRVFLDIPTQRWQVTSPPCTTLSHEVGLEVTRGRFITSMSMDFGEDAFVYRRFLNEATQIVAASAGGAEETPSQHFTATVNAASPPPDVQTAPPVNAEGLTAVVEGSTLATAEFAQWTAFVAGDRMVVDIKPYGSRAGTGALATLLKQHDQGPSNPINWLAVTLGVGDTPENIQTELNDHYKDDTNSVSVFSSTANDNPSGFEVMGAAGTRRLLLTERQISSLPSKPYIESKDVDATPVTIGNGAKYYLNVFSADPKNGNAGKWISIMVDPWDGVGLAAESNPDAVAAYLNAPIYDSTHANYIGDLLDTVGFFAVPHATENSLNPGLSANSWGERQFLWVASDDPRHSGGDTVRLLCGGWGSSTLAGERDFYNVLVECPKTDGDGTTDIATILGAEFVPGTYAVPRCGLFFGDHAFDVPNPKPAAVDFTGAKTTHATGNTKVGWDADGVEPLGILVGSHEITTRTATTVEYRLATGAEARYFKGPQASNIAPEHLSGTAKGVPYLGRWVWGLNGVTCVDLTVATNAGQGQIWLAYGSRQHTEEAFTSYLTAVHQEGYESFLVQAEDLDATTRDIKAPNVAENPRRGDFIRGVITDGAGTLQQAGFEGSVTNVTTDNNGLYVEALVVPSHGPFGSGQPRSTKTGYHHAQGVQPGMLGAFRALGNPGTGHFVTSIIADPNATAASPRSVLMAYETLHGPKSLSETSGSGLTGGSYNSRPNAVFIGGGRVALFSLLGPSAPAGISMSSLTVGSSNISTPRSSTTFIEHGVFTNAVALSRNHFGGLLDSKGAFDAFRSNQEDASLVSGSPQVGGIAGVRFSGDTQVWLTGLKPLQVDRATAHVRTSFNVAHYGGLSIPWNVPLTGPVTAMGWDAGHMPSGFGAARSIEGSNPYQVQEATVMIGLTRADYMALSAAAGHAGIPFLSDANLSPNVNEGERLFGLSLGSRLPDAPVLVKALEGMYLQLSNRTGATTHASNEGTWRVVGSPMLTRSGASFVFDGTNDSGVHYPDFQFVFGPNSGSQAIGSVRVTNNATVANGHTVTVGGLTWTVAAVPLGFEFAKGGTAGDTAQNLADAINRDGWQVHARRSGDSVILTSMAESQNGNITVSETSAGMDSTSLVGGSLRHQHGHAPESALVAVLQVRVERYAQVPVATTGSGSFFPDVVDHDEGYQWGFYADEARAHPLYVAKVVDPGGAPTGSPSGLRGISLDPLSLGDGRSSLTMDLVSVFTTSTETDTWPVETQGKARLYGIYEVPDHRGAVASTALFSMFSDDGAPTDIPPHSYARAVVYSSRSEDRVESLADGSTRGEFVTDGAGRVRFVGHPSRLGLGVVLDGGLGIVQANAIRATPRPAVTETLGSLTVYGQNAAFPLASYLNAGRGIGAAVPSSLNYTEFYDDAVIVGPKATLLFENARASKGLGYNLQAMQVAASVYRGPAQLAILRTGGSIPADAILPNDSLFPYSVGGVRFRTPGMVRYERAFRSLDATDQNAALQGMDPSENRSGIRGLEIPTFGECLLLPKGPPTPQGQGKADFLTTSGEATGATPLDLPLYEFTGATGAGWASRSFPIIPTSLVDNATFKNPDLAEGPTEHTGGPGTVSQAYRHSRSRENTAEYPNSGTEQQVRLLDGMVIEDVTNGTFYTVGAVGRWKAFPSAGTPSVTASLGQPGANDPDAAGGAAVVRSSVAGSLVGSSGGDINAVTYAPEVLYDIGPHCDPLVDPLTQASNGFGDRVDSDNVRRPLKGHYYRITPNVEFVPVLGPRGVDGGLLPPYDNSGNELTDADALLYSMSHSFMRPSVDEGMGDVGRMIYLCGTGSYWYTGWWIIIDVITRDVDVGGADTPRDVAVVRKLRRGKGRSGDATTLDNALPLGRYRAPSLRLVADKETNSNAIFTGVAGQYGDLVLEITNSSGASYFTHTESTANLNAGAVIDANSLATHCNGNANLNGTNTAAGVAFIKWTADPSNTTVTVTYDTTVLGSGNFSTVLGEKASLRVSWISNDQLGNNIGFYNSDGHAQDTDRCAGDRNNAATIKPAAVGAVKTAARGLRWVFSHPLTEENVGSYVHLIKPRLFRFGTELTGQNNATNPSDTSWTSGWPRDGDADEHVIDVFRVNRCPSTSDILLGGDCEVYYPEIIKVGKTDKDDGLGRPILYSPLSIMGNWPDADDPDALPSTGAIHRPILYALQPIARERLVTISPNSARSNILLEHGGGDANAPGGVGPAIAVYDNSQAAAGSHQPGFSVSEPWRLLSRFDVSRTQRHTNNRAELFNANDPSPAQNPLTNDSSYVWAPAGEWWQVMLPEMPDSTFNASVSPPTLRVDLTEAFTQAMQPGAGVNSPFPGHAPKGARLNRLWVNFGVWGNIPDGRGIDKLPGIQTVGGNIAADAVLDQFAMTFNLVVELPGSLAREVDVPNLSTGNDSKSAHPRGSGNAGMPFGGRAPTAAFSHLDNSGKKFPSGTIVVPLYCNREAGDIMPNVMERWVTVGPIPVTADTAGLAPDWSGGHYEHGFGNHTSDDRAMHSYTPYVCNSFNTVLWGGMDFSTGVFTDLADAIVQASVFPRMSRMGGGVRSAFTTGLVPDNTVFRTANRPDSLHGAALTGISVAHAADKPDRPLAYEGNPGTDKPPPHTTSQAFTIALTPVGDGFDTPKDASGAQVAVDASTSVTFGDAEFPNFGRQLKVPTRFQPEERPFKVGNWLDEISERYGIPIASGSMLPPGARVFLEITTNLGDPRNLSRRLTSSGCWVGRVVASFEVETADGTAFTNNVNLLGDGE